MTTATMTDASQKQNGLTLSGLDPVALSENWAQCRSTSSTAAVWLPAEGPGVLWSRHPHDVRAEKLTLTLASSLAYLAEPLLVGGRK
jgi:hypothetical protein